MKVIFQHFLICLLIHPSMFLLEFIVRGIDGDFMTGGLYPSTMSTQVGIAILSIIALTAMAMITGIMGVAISKKSKVAAIIIAPLLGLASLPYSLLLWFVYGCTTMGECF